MANDDELSKWELLYRDHDVKGLPWYIPDLDYDFEQALIDLGITKGDVLDLGTGPGTQAIALAEMGFNVTATDISQSAIDKAKAALSITVAGHLHETKEIKVDFRVDDIVDTDLIGKYDVILDRGCFHVLPPGSRHEYVRAVYDLLREGGYLLLKCFSHEQEGTEGPYRFSPQEIEGNFAEWLNVLSITDSAFIGTMNPHPVALFCVMHKES